MAKNLQQIADHLNLSVATVSRALQNHPRISDETRHRVTSAAAQMGYKPRRSGAALAEEPASGSVLPVTVLVQFDVDAWEKGEFQIGPVPFRGGEWSLSMNRILAGISKGARAKQVSAMVHYVPLSECQHIHESAVQPAVMRSFETNGLILVGYYEPDVVEKLSRTWQIVSMSHHYPQSNVDCIGEDAFYAIGRLMSRLHGFGHRNIGFINYMGHQSWAQLRHAAYIQALSKLGLPYQPEIMTNIDDRQIKPRRELDFVLRHFRRGENVTAWICADDVVAYRLYDDLQQEGISVPGDLSITGFNGMQPPQGFPLITGIRPQFGFMGEMAVQSILAKSKSPGQPTRYTLVRGDLVEGETSGPPEELLQLK